MQASSGKMSDSKSMVRNSLDFFGSLGNTEGLSMIDGNLKDAARCVHHQSIENNSAVQTEDGQVGKNVRKAKKRKRDPKEGTKLIYKANNVFTGL